MAPPVQCGPGNRRPHDLAGTRATGDRRRHHGAGIRQSWHRTDGSRRRPALDHDGGAEPGELAHRSDELLSEHRRPPAFGLDEAQAREELQLLTARYRQSVAQPELIVTLRDTTPNGELGETARLVFALIGTGLLLVFVLTCANVGNLYLARSLRRRPEIAVRLSLGASRARLVRQLLTEGLVMAALAGAGAFLVARSVPLLIFLTGRGAGRHLRAGLACGGRHRGGRGRRLPARRADARAPDDADRVARRDDDDVGTVGENAGRRARGPDRDRRRARVERDTARARHPPRGQRADGLRTAFDDRGERSAFRPAVIYDREIVTRLARAAEASGCGPEWPCLCPGIRSGSEDRR